MENNYYLAKWMNGELSEAELLTYVSAQEIADYKRIISHTKRYKKPALNSAKILENILETTKKPIPHKKRSFAVFYRIAALLVLSFSVYYFSNSTTTTFETNIGEKTAFVLPDNSEVHLNAKSKIYYDKSDWKNNRNLTLNGEAYFKVAKGAKFTVQTSNGTVTVLGTQFNVNSRNNTFEVTCFEGLVEVTYQNNTFLVAAKNSLKLIKNTPTITPFTSEITPYWTLGKSRFKSIPFHQVIVTFERQYNLQIFYPEHLQNEFYTGEFTHNNSEQALNAIALPFNLTITHKKQFVVLSK